MKIQLPLLLAFATVLASSAARAATFNVTSTADAGAGSLRQAVLDANASSANDTITFASNGVFVLISGALEIANKGSLTINGAAGISISGNNTSRIFFIDSDAKMTINNVTLRNGNDDQGGSAIVNDGVLTLDKCTLANNTTTNGAGAIYNLGRLIVTNSTFAGNTASYAGAILNDTASFKAGDPTPAQFTLLRNCTFSGNSGSNRGGAIYNENGLTLIQSCTIAGNRAPAGQGAGIAIYGDNSTRSRVQNSIIADNRAGGAADSGSDVDYIGGTNSILSQGHNAIGDGNAAAGFAQTGDKTGVTAAQLKFGALAYNGGPTQTLALLPGSVAIDAGATNLTTDQRGVQRPIGAAADIGAFEAPVPNAAPSVSNASVQTLEDKPFVFRGSNFGAGFSDPNAGDSLQSVRIDTLPKHGALKFKGQAVGVGKIMARANIGNLIFVPAADFNGTTNFKFSASDSALFSVKSATMTIQIVPVNDAPSFTLIGDQIVAQTSAPQNVKGFATALKVGPDNETGQTLTLLVSNDNAALFSQQPSINSNGTAEFIRCFPRRWAWLM